MTYFAIPLYAAALILANILVLKFGPAVTPVNAFVLIGLDLVLRDLLHVRLGAWRMAALIAATGLIAYLLNPAAGNIAVASAVAFTVAALADWAAFARLTGSWARRSNGSNVAGALVDSVLFPLLAFPALPLAVLAPIVAGQFAAKVLGGAAWVFVLSRFSGVQSCAK